MRKGKKTGRVLGALGRNLRSGVEAFVCSLGFALNVLGINFLPVLFTKLMTINHRCESMNTESSAIFLHMIYGMSSVVTLSMNSSRCGPTTAAMLIV
jgi:hypothetical protein